MVVSSLQTDSRGEQDSRPFSCFRNGRCLFSQTSCESDEALPGPAAADGVGGGAGGGGTVIGVRAVAACQTETGHEGLGIRGLASTLKHMVPLVTWRRRKLLGWVEQMSH